MLSQSRTVRTRTLLARTALAVGLFCSTPLAASAQVVTNAAQLQPGTYVVEPQHTQVSFSVLHFGFTVYEGLFSGASGTLMLDPRQPEASSLSVSIPVASVQTTSSKLTEELKGSEWLGAEEFPKAEFVSVSVRQTGRDDALVMGNLTLHGMTRPETMHVHFVGAGINMLDKKYTVGFDATTTIRRSDFGIKMFVPYVSDEVELRMAGAFEKQDPTPATETPAPSASGEPASRAAAPTQTPSKVQSAVPSSPAASSVQPGPVQQAPVDSQPAPAAQGPKATAAAPPREEGSNRNEKK